MGRLSVGQGRIELEFRDGFGVGGVERTALIELEHPLGREIEMGEDRAHWNGIDDERDDAHRSPARRADERPGGAW